MLEHPEIGWIERTGYPSWAQPKEEDQDEIDFDYEAEDDKDD
jgi:hypothetical protein